MSFNKKIFGLVFLSILLSAVASSFFLIKASIEDKQNYIFDLQTTNGLLLARTIKQGVSGDLPLQDFPGIAKMGIGIVDHKRAKWVFTKSPEGEEFPQIKSTPSSFEIGGELATSIHSDGYISTYVPLDKTKSLVIVSKDDPVFQMLEIYLNRTLPLLLGVLFFVGILSWLFSRRISQPLEGLSLSTAALGEGNWDIEIPKSTTKEIQTLASAFKELGVQLKKREQQLIAKERLSALGRFAAGMAHELKNPLNVISSYTQLIERGSSENEKIQKQTGVIRSEVDRAARIINDLMSFSRQKPLSVKKVPLKAFIENLVEKQKVSHSANIDWKLRVAENGLVKADEENLKQVLINLIENASHALEAQDDPTIVIEYNGGEQLDSIFVKDNGEGIPQDVLPHIFEPFYTTKTVGKGTGLGLAFCKGIMQQHGGDLIVHSSPDGTQFCLKLPK